MTYNPYPDSIATAYSSLELDSQPLKTNAELFRARHLKMYLSTLGHYGGLGCA